MALFEKLGNLMSGNGWNTNQQVQQNQLNAWETAQANAMRQQQEADQHSAQLVNQYSKMDTGEMLKNLMQNDAQNSSSWMNTFINYKMNSPEQKMADLKKAGINPLLAVNGGTTFEASPQVSTAMAQQNTREQKMAQKYQQLQMEMEKLNLRKESFILNTASLLLHGGHSGISGPFGIGAKFGKF